MQDQIIRSQFNFGLLEINIEKDTNQHIEFYSRDQNIYFGFWSKIPNLVKYEFHLKPVKKVSTCFIKEYSKRPDYFFSQISIEIAINGDGINKLTRKYIARITLLQVGNLFYKKTCKLHNLYGKINIRVMLPKEAHALPECSPAEWLGYNLI